MSKKNSLFKLELLILSVLSRKECYGYEICTIIKKETEGMFDIKEGVMYPILYSLSSHGYISDYEKIYNRRVRVYYRIEPSGIEYLKELKEEFQIKLELVQNLISEEKEVK